MVYVTIQILNPFQHQIRKGFEIQSQVINQIYMEGHAHTCARMGAGKA